MTPLEELVRQGQFQYVSPCLWDCPFAGDLVRGELSLLDFGGMTSRSEIELRLRAEGRVHATAYELVYFASHGWDGQESVAALGTVHMGDNPWLYHGGPTSAFPGRRLIFCGGFLITVKVLAVRV